MSIFKKFTDSVSKGVTSAAEKAQQTVEITRLNSQLSGKRKAIENLYTSIGEFVFEAYLEKDLSLAEPKVLPVCEEIIAYRSEITVLDDRIKELRNEKDCICGKRLPYDTRFCPSCGYAFPEPAIESTIPKPEQDPLLTTDPLELITEQRGEPLNSELLDPELQESIVDQRQICASCGTPLFADSHYCPTCGQSTR